MTWLPGEADRRRCGGSMPRAGLGWPDDRSPFPGLRPFDTDQQRVFFGRTEEVERAGDAVAVARRSAPRRGAAGGGPVGVREVVAGAGRAVAGDGRRTRLVDGAGDLAGAPAGGGADPGAGRRRPRCRRGLVDWPNRRRLETDGLAELANELLLAGAGTTADAAADRGRPVRGAAHPGTAGRAGPVRRAVGPGAAPARCRSWRRCARNSSIQLLLEPGARGSAHAACTRCGRCGATRCAR